MSDCWMRNTPEAPWNEPDPPSWYEFYVGTCRDDIGCEPRDIGYSESDRMEAYRHLMEIHGVVREALEVI